MEGFIALFIVVGILAVIDVLASRFGADSRPAFLDDWARDAAR
jgi:hypothetical protein